MAGRKPGLTIEMDLPRDDEDQDWAATTFRKDGVSISETKALLNGDHNVFFKYLDKLRAAIPF